MIYGGRSSVGRAPDCDSGCRGFEPHRSPQFFCFSQYLGPLAQLVEQLTLNQRVVGSKPTRPTICECGGIGRRAGFRFQWGNP